MTTLIDRITIDPAVCHGKVIGVVPTSSYPHERLQEN